ncbi:putative pre-16S rRNA nuclease [Trichonephila clavata]|uniref:Putative pre-16S rRNA nuclease n=1 Tax=Trichonephila clavata TaxID=2740835 RepID=A0A8X6LUQ4_TRICU|nr:putative pre-16S rRNA nuclease [Trichonephila clavata]
MLHRNPDEFLKSIPKDKRIMCLDMGEKQIGIAFSDKTQLIATAHSIYHRKNMSKDLGYLHRIFKENESGSMSLSESREERKFIIYTLVCLKEVIDEVYTTSVQESLRRILGVELANSLNGIVQAINNLLNCYEHEEIKRAKVANELDYRLGKLTLEETQQFVIGLGEGVGHLRGFEGQIADKQSISKLIDYRLDPKPNDREAATTLLNYILACTEIGTNNSLLSNSNIARVAANRYAQQG